MEPPKPREHRKPAMRATRPMELKPKAIAPQPTLPCEDEILAFFTNHCKLDDPASFESQFPDDFDLSFKTRKFTEESHQEDVGSEDKDTDKLSSLNNDREIVS